MSDNTAGQAVVLTGDGVTYARWLAWTHAARMAQRGMKTEGATLAAWGAQTDSTATRWAQVEREAYDASQAVLQAQRDAAAQLG